MRSLNLSIALLFSSVLLSACSSLISSQSAKMADGLSRAIRAQDDLQIVESGAPAYLLLMESMLQDDPDSPAMLLGTAKLYSFYGGIFAQDPDRQKRLNTKAFDLAQRGICIKEKSLCDLATVPLNDLQENLQNFSRAQIDDLYTIGSIWAGWLQANSGDWNAIAQIGRIKLLLQRVVELDEQYDHGSAHLYLAVMNSILPAAMGGKPELGREHFEKAIAISEGKNLYAKALMAKYYARLMFDQELHDRLVGEILADREDHPAYALSNQLARREAEALQDSAADYF